jgi:glucokinase
MLEVTIGIDIGGTNTKFGFVDRRGDCLGSGRVSTPAFDTPEEFIQALADAIAESRDGLRRDTTVAGVGIGAPDGNYYRGTVEHAPNLRWPGVIPLRDLFREHFDLPVVVTNDANAAALGEMMYGAAKGQRDFLVVTLGTGLGSGFVANGRLIYGHDGFAGELGHTIIEENGRLCGCGRRGCLETYASATGLVRTAREMLSSGVSSTLCGVPSNELTAERVTRAAKRGDTTALAIFDFTAKKLALGLANAVAITSPRMVVLCGGLARSGDIILAPTRRYLDEYILGWFQVELTMTGVPDENAGVLGAAALAWQEIENPAGGIC